MKNKTSFALKNGLISLLIGFLTAASGWALFVHYEHVHENEDASVLNHLEWVEHSEVPFNFLLTLNKESRNTLRQPPFVSYAFKLEKGVPKVRAIHFSDKNLIWLSDLKKIGQSEVYSYNYQTPSGWLAQAVFSKADPVTAQLLLESQGRDMLDGHDVIGNFSDGDYFGSYVPKDYGEEHLRELRIEGFSRAGGKRIFFYETSKSAPFEELKKFQRGEKYLDYLHPNSITEYGRSLVVSLRDQNSVWIIDRDTKNTQKIGKSNGWRFLNDPLDGFTSQHHATLHDGNILTLFDNGILRKRGSDWSRAVAYRLNFKTREATLVWELRAESTYYRRDTQGSVVTYGDYIVVGWGGINKLDPHCERSPKNVRIFSVFKNFEEIAWLNAPCGWSAYRVYPTD